MTVKVVEFPKQVQCEKCRAILEYVKSDVQKSKDGCYYIVCASCASVIHPNNGQQLYPGDQQR